MRRMRHPGLALALLLAAALALRAGDACAVDPNFKVYLDTYPLSPLERVVFAYDAGPTPLSTLTTPSVASATQLEAQAAWDFSGVTGEGVVLQTAPVLSPWTCYLPDPVRNDCGFELAGNDVLLVRDNLVTLSRGATALDFDGTSVLYERAQSIGEGAAGEIRLCLNPAYYPDVAYIQFQGSDARGRYLSGSDPAWQSDLFSCSSNLNSVTTDGNCGRSAGTGASFEDQNGCAGRALSRVVRAGTITLPSGHRLDSVMVEALASFSVRLPCFLDTGRRLRLYQLFWYVPHYGAIAQMSSAQDTASLDAFTSAESTSIGFGLLPPLSIQVDATTATSATVSWDPGRVTTFIDEFVVHWGTQPGGTAPPPDSSESRGDTIPASQTSYTVTGLLPATTYWISVTTKRSYADPKTAVTTVYRSVELPQSLGADVDGDGTQDTSYPPEVSATTASGGGDELLVNRQIRPRPAPPAPPVADQFTCGGLCADVRVPGPLPMSLPGEAAVAGRELLALYFHSSATTTMTVTRSGTTLNLSP